MKIVAGTRVLITGATGGVGTSLAGLLAARGAQLGLLGRSSSSLFALARGLPGEPMLLTADVAESMQVRAAVDRFVGAFGGIDLLVIAAGVIEVGNFVELDHAQIERLISVNLRGALITARAVAPRMVQQRRGHVVIIAGSGAWHSYPTFAASCASKAGMRVLGDTLFHELGQHGVQVTTAYPAALQRRDAEHAIRWPDWLAGDMVHEPDTFASQLLAGIERDKRSVFYPSAGIRGLALVSGTPPAFMDFVMRQARGRAAAPRRRRSRVPRN